MLADSYSGSLFFTERLAEIERRIKALGEPLFFTLPVSKSVPKHLTKLTRRAKRMVREARRAA